MINIIELLRLILVGVQSHHSPKIDSVHHITVLPFRRLFDSLAQLQLAAKAVPFSGAKAALLQSEKNAALRHIAHQY